MEHSKSEMLELARRMERWPEQFYCGGDGDVFHPDSREWTIIIDALRFAANQS